MNDSSILDTLTKCNGIIDKATVRLEALKYMLPVKTLIETDVAGAHIDGIEIQTVYQNEHCNIIRKILVNGVTFPKHSHGSSVTFFIVTHGKVLLKIGDIPRVMGRGECASIAIGINFSMVALEDSEIITVCAWKR